MVVNTVLMSCLLQIFLRFSLTPDTYGIQIVYLGVSSSSLSLLGFAADLMIWSGYPLVFRTSARCFSSLPIFSPTATVLARWKRQEATGMEQEATGMEELEWEDYDNITQKSEDLSLIHI